MATGLRSKKSAPPAPAQPIPLSKSAIPPPNDYFNIDFLLTSDKTAILTELNNFRNLTQYADEIRIIGQPSANGFIRRLKYQAGYDAVLKSSMEDDTDSLVYEYLVGQCINVFSKYYPCFSYTYAACQYKNETLWERMSEAPRGQVLRESISDYIQLMSVSNITSLIQSGCANNKISCILTQYVPMRGDLIDFIKPLSTYDPNFEEELRKKKVDQLKKMLKDNGIPFDAKERKKIPLITALNKNLNKYVFNRSNINELYKVALVFHMTYQMLNSFKNLMTHYDLHTGNVAIVEIPNNKVVEVIYKTSNKEVMRYKTTFIPAVIDYGRCYVNCSTMGESIDSHELLKTVCANDASNKGPCVDSCGNERGYGFSSPYNAKTRHFDETDENSYFINYTKKNNSHDLRFLKYFNEQIDFSQVDQSNYIYNLVQLLSRITDSPTEYGFQEKASVRGSAEIRNINDALEQLTNLVNNPAFVSGNDGKPVYGTITIHTDLKHPFSFVKA
jgi:hypothetical protein